MQREGQDPSSFVNIIFFSIKEPQTKPNMNNKLHNNDELQHFLVF